MSKIKILPEILSNKIAAGEVVERPFSVVKELVENAIDAESTQIIIEIEKGGRSLIRISDNGIGMNHDDALLAIERYATSKIYTDDDLFSIATLGFRGEALPSIASVSKFTIVTKDEHSEAGTEIIIEGGKIKKVSETGAPTGTMITVKQLFFNTPARRKFLKTINTEMSHIADTLAGIALGRPDIQFKLVHNGKVVKSWPLANDPYNRVVDVLGREVKNDLHEVAFQDAYMAVSGWVSSPRVTRSTSKRLFVYVNGRIIRDRGLQYALFEGYRGRLMKGQFPVAVLFVTVPFDQVDVNVHPTKNEVRFARQRQVYETVRSAVSEIWPEVERSKWSTLSTGGQTFKSDAAVSGHIPDYAFTERQVPFQARKTYEHVNLKEPDLVCETVAGKPYNKESDSSGQPPVLSYADEPVPAGNTGEKEYPIKNEAPIRHEPPEATRERTFSELKIIGQLHDTYIVCESDRGLILIDQHAAHERIYFEQLKKRSSGEARPSQRLLVPETLDLSYKETAILEKMIPDFNRLGIEIEPFGGNTFVVKSLPSILSEREIKPVITEMLEKIDETGFSSDTENFFDECLIVMACHSAIRANHRLSEKELTALLKQLDTCEDPSHCPHGRPTWINWTLKSLEKMFKRTV